MNRLLLAFAAVLALATSASAQLVSGGNDNTSVDASQLASSVQKLEAAPIGGAGNNLRRSLLNQFTATPGMGYLTCTGLFASTSPDAARNNAILSKQLAIGAYSFQYQHLGSEPDNAVILQAGIESLLRAYRNMSGYSDPSLDVLAKERESNTLLPHIRSALLNHCKLTPNHDNG